MTWHSRETKQYETSSSFSKKPFTKRYINIYWVNCIIWSSKSHVASNLKWQYRQNKDKQRTLKQKERLSVEWECMSYQRSLTIESALVTIYFEYHTFSYQHATLYNCHVSKYDNLSYKYRSNRWVYDTIMDGLYCIRDSLAESCFLLISRLTVKF